MNTSSETVLNAIPASRSDERLLLVLVHSSALGSRLELRQQSWSEGIGWFTQSRVEIDTDQVADLRGALGSGTAGRSRLPGRAAAMMPRIHAESA